MEDNRNHRRHINHFPQRDVYVTLFRGKRRAKLGSICCGNNPSFGEALTTKVLSQWKFFKKIMAQGNGTFIKAFIIYLIPGLFAMLTRRDRAPNIRSRRSRGFSFIQDTTETTSRPQQLRGLRGNPFISLSLVLLVGTIFLPAQPWRHLTTTIIYDFFSTVSMVMITQHFKERASPTVNAGNNPLGNLNYNPVDDPYYISNLHQPIDPFIASALKDTKFTNIFHIVLESMREDSFPYDENGLLHQHILKNLEPVEDGVPVTTENITPFMASLAENTLSWHTVWTAVPYTHKAMIGCECSYSIFADC
jgi:hypothetical protein